METERRTTNYEEGRRGGEWERAERNPQSRRGRQPKGGMLGPGSGTPRACRVVNLSYGNIHYVCCGSRFANCNCGLWLMEHVRSLLNVTSDLPDNELLLPKHFVAILSAVWREKCCLERTQSLLSSQSGYHFSTFLSKKSGMDMENLSHCKELVMSALVDTNERYQEQVKVLPMVEAPVVTDQVELTLDLSLAKEAYTDVMFPPLINVTLQAFERRSAETHGSPLAEPYSKTAENRFRRLEVVGSCREVGGGSGRRKKVCKTLGRNFEDCGGGCRVDGGFQRRWQKSGEVEEAGLN
ncbi:hypothetical protein KSP40_PGU022826 [Platanthera guangdongensis]|uniref:Uncharacterized protein n=1 Tax=Platanthera guangdongensis TaxID=2320717 RepID=A0ABR2MH16_9ASPA